MAPAVGGRTATVVIGAGPGRTTRDPLPRRAHRWGRPRRAPGRARHRREAARSGGLRGSHHARARGGGTSGRSSGHHRQRAQSRRGHARRPHLVTRRWRDPLRRGRRPPHPGFVRGTGRGGRGRRGASRSLPGDLAGVAQRTGRRGPADGVAGRRGPRAGRSADRTLARGGLPGHHPGDHRVVGAGASRS